MTPILPSIAFRRAALLGVGVVAGLAITFLVDNRTQTTVTSQQSSNNTADRQLSELEKETQNTTYKYWGFTNQPTNHD
jgi:hypothetical protein